MKYDAFISYRHTEPDMYVAKKVHKTLETFRIPKKIRKATGKKKIERVFRDQEELPIGSDLGNNIEAALEASEYLIVICSPRAKESDWVKREIDTFIKMHGREKVLAVLVEGEPQDSFPPAILTDENGNPVEPLAADVRGASTKEIRRKLKTECMRLAAPILGCSFDDLRQRHRERKMRKYFAIAIGISALGVAFGVYNAMVARQISLKNVEITQKNEEITAKNEEILAKNEEIVEKNTQMLINQSKYLADLSLEVYETGDRKTAGLLALEGLPVNDERPLVPDSLYALSNAMDVYSIGAEMRYDQVLKHDFTVAGMRFNDDASKLVSRDNGHCVYLWDVEKNELLVKLNPEMIEGKKNDVFDVNFLGDSFVSADKFGFKRLDFEGNELLNVKYDKYASFSAISNDGTLLLANHLSFIDIFDTKTGEMLYQFEAPNGRNFSADMVFSSDLKYAATSSGSSGYEQNAVNLINLETGVLTSILVDQDSIIDLIFTEDGNLAAASYNFYTKENTDYFTVDLIDVEKCSKKWTKRIDYTSNILSTSYTWICSKIYTDKSENEHRELSVCEGRYVYTMNLDNGNDISTINVSSDIEKILVNKTSSYGFIAERNGNFDICDFTDGETYPNSTIKVGEGLVDVALRNSVLIARHSNSSVITVLKKIQSPTIETFAEDGRYISTIIASPDESKICYFSSETLVHDALQGKVYDTASGELLQTFVIEDSIEGDGRFLDDKRVIFKNYSGILYEYNLETKNVTSHRFMDKYYSVEVSLDQGNKTALVYTGKNYLVISLEDYSELIANTVEPYIYKAAYSENSKYIVTMDYNYVPYRIDLETGETTGFSDDLTVNAIDLSSDGKIAVLACTDGVIREYNLKTLALINEIEDFTSTNSYVKISDDGKSLYYQPADLQIKIYDLENMKYNYVSSGAFYQLDSIQYEPTNHILILKNPYAMYLIDCDSYGMLGKAEYGNAFLPKSKCFLSENGNTIYRLKYYSPSELLEAAKEKYQGQALSEEQRLSFFLD